MKKNNYIIRYFLIFLIGFLLSVWIFYEPKQTENKQIIELKNNETLFGMANIVAVDQNNLGLLGKTYVEISEGSGKVLINTNPFLEPDTQYSANIASLVASNITNIDISNKNIIYDFEISGQVLGGPSAGLSITLATISALKQIPLKEVVFTGTINKDGSIGKIGGIFEKAQAVADNNLSLFLIPKGQNIFQYYEPIETEDYFRNTKIIRRNYILKEINLAEYFKENYNLTIIEISNINEAIGHAF